MPFPLALLPLLAQIGPTGTVIEAPLEIHRSKPAASSVPVRALPQPVALPTRLGECLTLARSDPAAALTSASAWRDGATGEARAEAGQCLGMAQVNAGDLDAAKASFLAARTDTPGTNLPGRARLGSMAANAVLADGDAQAALALLDTAHGDALGGGDHHLAAEIAIDRARALVLLKRDNDAAGALAEARAGAIENATAWLLSATLSRRQGKLGEAQSQIERAAALQPLDPEIGLEAGVIAVLGGRDGAARRSWQSVIEAAPGSEAAKTAQGYLDQLGPDTAPSGR